MGSSNKLEKTRLNRGGEKMKGIIPFSCIDDVVELTKLFEQTGRTVTVEKNYIRVEEEDENEGN